MNRFLAAIFLAICVTGCGGATPHGPLPDRADKIVQGVNYVGVVINDIEQSSSIYTTAGDLTVTQNTALDGNTVINELAGRDVVVKTRLLRSVNGQIRLMQFENPSQDALSASPVGIQGPGFSHVCFQAAAKKMTLQRFLEAGATPLASAEMVTLNPRNPVQYAYLRDIDQTIIEVEHVDFSALDPDVSPKNDHRLRHVAIATSDVDRAANFYSVLFEDSKPRRIGGANGFGGASVDKLSGIAQAKLRMAWFQIRNMEFEIGDYVNLQTPEPNEPRAFDATGYNMIVFDVTDIERARQLLLDAGGSIASELGELDGGQIFFGRDKDLNLLGFQVIGSDALVSAKRFKDNGA